jgi:integrase
MIDNGFGGQQRKSVYGKTHEECYHKMDELLRAGVARTADRSLLRSRLEEWLEDGANKPWAYNTYDQRWRCCENHINPYLGNTKTSLLTKEICRRWLRTLEKNNVGQRTRQVAFSVLRAALKTLPAKTWVEFPLTSDLEPKYTPPEKPIPGEPEARRVIELAEQFCGRARGLRNGAKAKGRPHRDNRYYALIRIGVTRGCREGELFGLRWSFVNLDRGYIEIVATLTKQYECVCGHRHKKTSPCDACDCIDFKNARDARNTKTETSTRQVRIDEQTVAALRDLRLLQESEGYEGEWVFPNQANKPLDQRGFMRWIWQPLMTRSGLPVKTTFHDFRHVFATMMAENHVPLKAEAQILGHKSEITTQRIYTKVTQRMTNEAYDAADEIFGTIGNGKVIPLIPRATGERTRKRKVM